MFVWGGRMEGGGVIGLKNVSNNIICRLLRTGTLSDIVHGYSRYETGSRPTKLNST